MIVDYELYVLSAQFEQLIVDYLNLYRDDGIVLYETIKNHYASVMQIQSALSRARRRGDAAWISEYEALLTSYPPQAELLEELQEWRAYADDLMARKREMQEYLYDMVAKIEQREKVFNRLVAKYHLDTVELPEGYANTLAVVREREKSRVDIYFSDSDDPLDATHGHYIVDKKGSLVYRRDPGVRQW